MFEYLGNQSLMVAFEDITSQKIKEAELQASQNNLQIIFDNTLYAMLVITDGVFKEAFASRLILRLQPKKFPLLSHRFLKRCTQSLVTLKKYHQR
ncbi:MAG TPA: hypothetical protein VN429_04415 [Methanospirillum sp.]|uniref:hypothetical protein n=1 Tax=Methanospirillum sp. TaxID=45200 RepID=UPI002C64B796|nr:hypothetical protein [Methanospirillum sp.]HWQ63639.1 hypothetical protein [Methanospirillum sp.]